MCRKARVALGARRGLTPRPVAPTILRGDESSDPAGQFARRPGKVPPTASQPDRVRTRQFSIAVPSPFSGALNAFPPDLSSISANVGRMLCHFKRTIVTLYV